MLQKLWKIFLVFAKIGAFTFGGGYAMIPLIQSEVLANEWLTQQQLVDFIAVSESTPGPFAINIATFVGMQTYGIPGALATTIGVILPSFVIILIIAKFFLSFRENRYVKAAMSGLRPTVIGLIIAAAYSVSGNIFLIDSIRPKNISAFFTECIDYKAVIIFVLLFGLSRWKKMSPILIILTAGGMGIIFYGLLPAF